MTPEELQEIKARYQYIFSLPVREQELAWRDVIDSAIEDIPALLAEIDRLTAAAADREKMITELKRLSVAVDQDRLKEVAEVDRLRHAIKVALSMGDEETGIWELAMKVDQHLRRALDGDK